MSWLEVIGACSVVLGFPIALGKALDSISGQFVERINDKLVEWWLCIEQLELTKSHIRVAELLVEWSNRLFKTDTSRIGFLLRASFASAFVTGLIFGSFIFVTGKVQTMRMGGPVSIADYGWFDFISTYPTLILLNLGCDLVSLRASHFLYTRIVKSSKQWLAAILAVVDVVLSYSIAGVQAIILALWARLLFGVEGGLPDSLSSFFLVPIFAFVEVLPTVTMGLLTGNLNTEDAQVLATICYYYSAAIPTAFFGCIFILLLLSHSVLVFAKGFGLWFTEEGSTKGVFLTTGTLIGLIGTFCLLAYQIAWLTLPTPTP